MKKLFRKFLMIILFSIIMIGTHTQAEAKSDHTAPEITKVEILKKEVVRPGIAKVRVHFKEEDTGVKYISVSIGKIRGNGKYSEAIGYIDDKSLYTGYVDIKVPLSVKAPEGTWFITNMKIIDNKGNENEYITISMQKEDDTYEFSSISAAEDNEPFEIPTMEVKDEFDVDFEVSLSNPKLCTKLEKMDEGKVAKIFIDKSSKGILKKDVFETIKGKNKTIVAYNDDGIKWIFNGKDINEKTKNIDLNMSIKTINLNINTKYQKAIEVKFANNGQLPGKAQIRFKSDYLYNLYKVFGKMNLYYIGGNELTKEKNANFDMKFDGTDKWCYFDVTHNSSYIIYSKGISYSNLGYTIKKIKKATVSSNGQITYVKKKNPKQTKKEKIYKVSGIKLYKTEYVYNKKVQRPKVVVKDSKGKNISSSNYKITYSNKNSKSVGTYKVKVTFKGKKYSGSKTLTYKIIPKKVNITTLEPKSKGFILKWTKQTSQTTGYQIQYSINKNFKTDVKTVTVKKNTTVSKTVKKLKETELYYVRIRAYKTVNKKNYYSKWSSVSKVMTNI